MKVLVVVSAVLAVAAAQFLPYSGYGYLGYPYAAGYGLASTYNAFPYTTYKAATPVTYAAAPYAHTTYAAAPYYGYAAPAAVSSQYHAQNELGGYSYGYADGLSTKSESKNALGGTVGQYSYVDANGITQTVSYVADALGFRVKATNLPVAPVADLKAPVHTLAGPAPVEDTAEVKAAKAEFQKLYDEAAAAAEAAPDSRKKRSADAAPVPVSDTPEVAAAKAEHARLYAAAAAAAEAAPDTDYPALTYAGYPYAGYPYAAYPYAALPAVRAAAPAGFSYGYSSAHYAGYPFYGRYYY